MRSVLIVSPHFPPTSGADLHRVRTSLVHYRECGWEPTVLCIDPKTSDCAEDGLLDRSLPPDIRVVRVAAWDEMTCRRFGFGALGYRSLLPLYCAGSRLLRQARFDAVFFSTTVFTSFVLGRLWKLRFGCRIVFDVQDPWYCGATVYDRSNAPGGWWKYRIDQILARRLEAFALKAADHIIVVSDHYVLMLMQRYRWLSRRMFTVLPFGADAGDYDILAAHNVEQTIFKPKNGCLHWVSVGRAGPDMVPVLTALFESLAAMRSRDPPFIGELRLEFVGTNYAPPGRTRDLVAPTARACGVAELVGEHPVRVPYFEALALYRDSDAILLLGSVHADYTPSKLMICALSKKPILALLHRRSTATPIAAQFPNIFLATFDETPQEPLFREKIAEGIAWLRAARFDERLIAARVKPWWAAALARQQCAIFDRTCAAASPGVKTPGQAKLGSRLDYP